MQKPQRNSVVIIVVSLFMAFVLSAFNVVRKETVVFHSADSLQITADEYIIAKENPYILLFHEQGSSRGEFESIAQRLCKMDYNCLAVDMRNGGNMNFLSNETLKKCQETRCPMDLKSLEADMQSAIEYAYGRSGQPVILFGSSANGSLCLKVAGENGHVRAVVAFSPGEYFHPEISIQDTISGMKKPTFVSSSLSELPYVSQLVSGIEKDYVTIFEPEMGEGKRGSATLSIDNENYSEYWLALLLFFKDLI